MPELKATAIANLKCGMTTKSIRTVTHTDRRRFIYSRQHANRRREHIPCRKLQTEELKGLDNGETVTR